MSAGLQDEKGHAQTTAAMTNFLEKDGPRIQEKLEERAKNRHRCGSMLVCLASRTDCAEVV